MIQPCQDDSEKKNGGDIVAIGKMHDAEQEAREYQAEPNVSRTFEFPEQVGSKKDLLGNGRTQATKNQKHQLGLRLHFRGRVPRAGYR